MIVTRTSTGTRSAGAGAEKLVRCLARRGMLHSECEAYEFVRLAPRVTFAGACRAGADHAWYVVDGSLALDGADLSGGSLVLVARRCETCAVAGPAGATLLVLSVLPATLAARLPHRAPAMSPIALAA